MEKNLSESTHLLIDGRSYGQVRTQRNVLKGFSAQLNNFGSKSFVLLVGAVVLLVSLSLLTFLSETHGTRNILGEVAQFPADEIPLENQDPTDDKTVLQIPLGKLVPVEKRSRDGRQFFAFYKVPYAKAPVGDLMFKPPQPIEEWNEPRHETKVAPECIQKVKYSSINESHGEVDCLYMNIYTPQLTKNAENSTNLIPTMVYIHGGGVSNGNASRYGPDYFMDEDVVLITFEFRLGVFGYLNLGDGITENLGSKDQIMVLKWVQSYIKYFGGDPKRVTIFGNSSGGNAVGLHILSPMSKGLFQRAILQSGGSLLSVVINSKPEYIVESVKNATGCSSSSNDVFLQCLRGKNTSELAILSGSNFFAITLEKNSSNAFLTDYPLNILRSGKVNEAQIIIGTTSAESLPTALDALKSPEKTDLLNENWAEEAPSFLDYKSPSTDPEMSSKIYDFYFGETRIGNETMTNLINLCTDKWMTHRAKVEAVYQAAVNPVYMYFLTKESAKSYAETSKEGYPEDMYFGPAHADELQFLFPYEGYPYIPIESEYYSFSKMLVKIWSQFAATGRPSTSNGDDWKRIQPAEEFLEWYMLDDQSKMVDTLGSRMKFWDQFPASDLKYI